MVPPRNRTDHLINVITMKILKPEQAIKEYNIHSSNYIHESVTFIVENDNFGLSIGTNNNILAGTVIYTGSGYREKTVLGSNNFIGSNSIINSDAFIGNNNHLIGSCYIGFHSCIQNNIYIDFSVSISNYCTIGSYCYIGTLTPIIKDIRPFTKAFGNPCQIKGAYLAHSIIKKYNIDTIEEIKKYVSKNEIPSDTYLISIIDEFKNQSRKKEL